ncbi:unnamed protein product [Closterium sp. NIES-53]
MRRCSGSEFYHPTSRRVFPSKDVTFDESVPFYHLFPYRSAPPPPPPLFLALGPPRVDPLPPQGPAPSGAASGRAEPRGVESKGAGSGGAEPTVVETGGVEPGGAEPEGADSGGAEPRVELQELEALETLELEVLEFVLELVVLEVLWLLDVEVLVLGVLELLELVVLGALELETLRSLELLELEGTGAGGAGAGGAGAAGAGAVDPGAGGAGSTVRPRPYFFPLLEQPASPLPAPSPYTEQSGGLTERREPASRPVSPVCTAPRVPRLRPPPVPGTHAMALRPSSIPLRVPLPAPPESSLPEVPDPESDRARAASPTVSRLLATAVTDPSFESAAASALDAELLEFAAA